MDAFLGGLEHGDPNGAWAYAGARAAREYDGGGGYDRGYSRGRERSRSPPRSSVRRVPDDLEGTDFAYTSYSKYGKDHEHARYEEKRFRRKREQTDRAAVRLDNSVGSYKIWRKAKINHDAQRWVHSRDPSLYVDWWPNSKRQTVFCQRTGWRGNAYSKKQLYKILDRFEHQA